MTSVRCRMIPIVKRMILVKLVGSTEHTDMAHVKKKKVKRRSQTESKNPNGALKARTDTSTIVRIRLLHPRITVIVVTARNTSATNKNDPLDVTTVSIRNVLF